YRLKSAQVALGTKLREIIEHREDNGLYADRSPDDLMDAMLRRWAEGRVEQFLSQLSDGRTVVITMQAMADGATVTRHQDITEQRRSEAKIRQWLRSADPLAESDRAWLRQGPSYRWLKNRTDRTAGRMGNQAGRRDSGAVAG